MPSAGAQSFLVEPRRETQLQLLCKPQALSLSASGLSEGHTSLPATERLLQLGGDAQTSESERQALRSGSGTCCQHAPGPVADPLEASVSPPVKLGSSWISLTEIPFRNAPEECPARNRRTAPGVLVWTLAAVRPVPPAAPRSPLLRPRGITPRPATLLRACPWQCLLCLRGRWTGNSEHARQIHCSFRGPICERERRLPYVHSGVRCSRGH